MSNRRIHIDRWDGSGPRMTEAAVRQLHVPAENFRISPCRYEAGTRFAETMRQGLVYILAGSCSWRFADELAIASKGDIVHAPEGGYGFEVLGDNPCEIIFVWNLSEV